MGTPIDVNDLLRRVEVLERALGVKPQPSRTWPMMPPGPFTPQPEVGVSRCARCGLNLSGVMGYVCPVNDCPTMLRSS